MNNLMELQNSLNRTFRLHTGGVCKIGKVIGTTIGRGLIDVALLDGGTLQNVVVLASIAASDAGISTFIAPSVDREVLLRKTYPDPPAGEIRDIADPSTIAAVRKAAAAAGQTLTVNSHRDCYVAVLPCEGGNNNWAGWVCIGYIMPHPSEMHYDSQDDHRFTDHTIYRHPSDLVISIDRNGMTTIQHPSGGRISMGETYAYPHSGDSADVRDNALDLKGQDLDGLFKLKKNLDQKVSVVIEDNCGNQIMLDGTDCQITISRGENDDQTIQLTKDGIEISAQKGSVQISSQGDIGFQTDQYSTSVDGIINAFNQHTHPDPQGGVTGPPVEQILPGQQALQPLAGAVGGAVGGAIGGQSGSGGDQGGTTTVPSKIIQPI